MGQPFLVNSYQKNWQRSPVIMPQADGGFLIVWESYLNEYDEGPSATYVAGQYFDAGGSPIGSEFVIAGSDGTLSGSPELTQLPDGGMVITWIYDDYDDILTIDTEIHAMVVNADGSIRQDDFRADTVASNRAVRPVVTVTGDGGFVISFGADRSTTNFDQVYARAYTAQGEPKGQNFLLNTVIQDFDQLVTRGATLTDGRAVIIWNSEATIDDAGTGQNDIRASILNPDGSVLRTDFRLAPSIGGAGSNRNYGYDVTATADGGFVMVHQRWSWDYRNDHDADGTSIVMAFYGRNGNARTAEMLVYETDELLNDVRITQLQTGEIVVVWTQHSETPGDIGDDAYGRIFSASGQPLGPIFEIGVDLDEYTDQEGLEVEALVGGGFIVAYMDEGIDSDGEGVAARIYGRGTDGNDQMTVDASGYLAGLGGNDRLTGNGRSNRLDGGAGDDLLRDLAGGNDTLTGGSGKDSLQGGLGNDVLDGGAGFDTALFSGTAAIRVDLMVTGPQNTGQGRDILRGIEHVTADRGNDVLKGSAVANLLAGNGGRDLLVGRAGHDTLTGGAGNDTLSGDNGNDLLLGGLGSDTAIFDAAGGVRVNLNLTGVQATGQGTDQLAGIENLTGGAGADRLQGNTQANVLGGAGGNDTLTGWSGNDLLVGGGGHDRLAGGNGNDTLIGGGGADWLAGGNGADSFNFNTNSGNDRIVDFDAQADVIRIDVANPGAPGVSVSATAGGTLIAWGSNSVLVTNVTPGQLDDDALIFI